MFSLSRTIFAACEDSSAHSVLVDRRASQSFAHWVRLTSSNDQAISRPFSGVSSLHLFLTRSVSWGWRFSHTNNWRGNEVGHITMRPCNFLESKFPDAAWFQSLHPHGRDLKIFALERLIGYVDCCSLQRRSASIANLRHHPASNSSPFSNVANINTASSFEIT